jgi:cytochrome c-type biogenesis protein CcmH
MNKATRRLTFRARAARWAFLLPLAACLLLVAHALAVEPSERLADPALEARARVISAGLRCLVCQNESIDDSQAGLAHDIRMLVRRRLSAGDSDAQTIQAVVARYGEFVLLKPPVEPATYLLWFGPPVLLCIGLGGIAVWLRRRPASVEAAIPLNPAERERLDRLMSEGNG